MEYVAMIISALSSIAVAVIGAIATASNKRQQSYNERAEARAALRERENRLQMSMVDATLQLSVVTSNALTGAHNNGNVERAREAAVKASKGYNDFLRDIAAHEVSK